MLRDLGVAGRTVPARQRLPADGQRQLIGGRDQLCLQAGAFAAALQMPGRSSPGMRDWHGHLRVARSVVEGDGCSGIGPEPSSVWLKIGPGKDRLNGQRRVFRDIAGVVHATNAINRCPGCALAPPRLADSRRFHFRLERSERMSRQVAWPASPQRQARASGQFPLALAWRCGLAASFLPNALYQPEAPAREYLPGASLHDSGW